ncbi:uncharacterized protein LOC120671148 [Panicum virgatum]|uniref:uncharacterized protein LOC120671148 n=1 Tax=Panicum virgatum TaxID=38727 RepID=UPI0019D50348|nr:uncharacterized protein LOC120671148 [Panicum virgatum]
MGGIELDLNLDPPSDDLDQNDLIDWDGIEEWDGPAHELDYNLVWHDGDEADGDADMEDAEGAGDGGVVPARSEGVRDGGVPARSEGARDGRAPARSGGSAASEGVRSAGQEGKAYAAFLVQ